MNRDRLLADAKQRALDLVPSYAPPTPATFRLPGPSGRAALDLAVDGLAKRGDATAHDRVVAHRLGAVITGGEHDLGEELPEEELRRLEREAFLALVRHPATLARIEHMLTTGRPLRN